MGEGSDVGQLREALSAIDAIPNEEWVRRLEPRKLAELAFHDLDRKPDAAPEVRAEMHANRQYYQANTETDQFLHDWIEREVPSKVFLDYACGYGTSAILAAKAGASLAIGIDISRGSIDLARQAAEAAGVADRTFFVQTDAESTKIPSGKIDRVVCSGVLHHMDVGRAFPELARIMAPGGKLLAVEALNYNPAIKLYRKLTPEMRTDWEKDHILSMREVKLAKKWFEVSDLKFWHIASIAAPHFPRLAPVLKGFDAIATKIPGLRLMAWMFSFELTKRGG